MNMVNLFYLVKQIESLNEQEADGIIKIILIELSNLNSKLIKKK